MPTNPATKSQVQAYRFVLRRMESALVRKDAVMQHEPMRNHLRASAVGLILAVLGLAAFYVVGLFSHTGTVQAGDIVNIQGTTSVFVVLKDTGSAESVRLVPVLNLTSARLLYAAMSPGSKPPQTKFVDESALAGIRRTAITGLPDAPQTLPDPARLIKGAWSVCDTATIRQDLPNAQSRPELSTTAVIGTQLGRPLGRNDALLVAEQSTGAHYLIWNGHRLPVDPKDNVVSLAYHLDGVVPRPVSSNLLNAIPLGATLAAPDVPEAGSPPTFPQLRGVRIGDVVKIMLAGQSDSYFLVLSQGVEQVEPAVANLIRAAHPTGGSDFITVDPADIADVPKVGNQQFADFPPEPLRVPGIIDAPIACLVWPGPGKDLAVTVSATDQARLNDAVEVPGATRDQADKVLLEPGSGALVQGVVPDQPAGTGQIWLVTEQGLRYQVPSRQVASALGFDQPPTPAPDSILGLLRAGPTLDPQQALALFDPERARHQGGP